MSKRGDKEKGLRTEQAMPAPQVKRPLSLAWVVIGGPLAIVLFLSLFEGLPWVAEQSTLGAQGEATTHNTLGQIAMEAGRLREAMEQYATALKIKPDYAESYTSMGIVYYLNGDWERAIACFRKSIELEPKKKELIYNNLGMVYARKGDFQAAMAMFNQALSLDIKSVSVYRNIGNLCVSMESWEGAVEAFRKAIDNKPTLERLYVDRLNSVLEAREDEEVCRAIEVQLQKGVSAEDLAQYDSVVVNEYVWSDPKLAEDFRDLGNAYARLGKIDEAIVSYSNALKVTPDNAPLHNKLGIMFGRSGRLEEAQAAFQKAVELDPQFSDARENLALCKRRLGEPSE